MERHTVLWVSFTIVDVVVLLFDDIMNLLNMILTLRNDV